MLRHDSSDEDSRTIAIGTKRARATTGLHRISWKRTKYRHRVGYQDLRDFVPRGGHFGLAPLAESRLPEDPLDDLGQTSDFSGSSSDYQIPQSSSTIAMNWNSSAQSSIRTSLRGGGGDLGQNRLATGFRSRAGQSSGAQGPHDVVEISDDSGVEDGSEGGILLNVDASSRVESSTDADNPVEISGDEDGEADGSPSEKAMASSDHVKAEKQRLAPRSNRNVTLQAQSSKQSNMTSPMFQIDARRGSRILADLNPEDLEKQIKYTLFHLPRDQIDLSRPVVCTACLTEGHTDEICPGLLCSSCGGPTNHSTRLCPKCARCSKCKDRGHDVTTCRSKLKNTNPEPCDFCGGADHDEVSCIQRFFPAHTELPGGDLQLWISCAQCGSKDHLAGDCPVRGSRPASAWSLRAYSRYNIVNLNLQTGAQAREKEAENKGIRPEGMQIKGRGALSTNKYPKRGQAAENAGLQFGDGDDEDFTTRLADTRSRRPSPPRSHIHFHDNDRGRMNRGNDDHHYRPRPDRNEPPNDYNRNNSSLSHDYRDRNGYGGGRGYQDDRDYRSQRPRSRSPPRFNGGDSWRPPPPLPRGPPPQASLPARPAPPRNQQQSQNQNQNQKFSKKGKRGGKGGGNRGGGGGGGTVRPMPSAAKNAWNRGRL
ncbi:hypothetical protein EPUS_05309 [Endocarpon pusillum Z07020]|uniref:CCHC-type domain-containing protein n=1 Tax=Endocarpon pusillum (strain Z07020 / HMAS-L-300199) TaxID=1263415 RepID=U1G1X2_ENDPU|nr:uncharacterized protein EPUS_05309 [Endocarpon pusillum Z07020]ERF71257.1 hypothetical protein EPUS_05309 [Endocarpon pusillum Z07020]